MRQDKQLKRVCGRPGSAPLDLVAGFCLAIGAAVPYAAGALILFTVAANLLVLPFWRHHGPGKAGAEVRLPGQRRRYRRAAAGGAPRLMAGGHALETIVNAIA
ncbi:MULTISPECIES: DoxX family protein [unclassified Mesorhizobium]|uniref:DoxX family protein n=1 Tax=unclassified Mesorhizobium TaxID=325217 RepID=UPI0015E40AA2|nr:MULTISPECIES: DoxX family protein [unclassified Mesorhizobium]